MKKCQTMKKQNTTEVSSKFLNPFDKGVSYVDFIKAMGTQKIDDYCKGKLTEEQIEFLKTEIKLLTKK